MENKNRISPIRRIIGDILLVPVILLTADLVFVMHDKINAVVLKANYQTIFRIELILCAVLLLSALDVRVNLFTRSKVPVLRITGWVMRSVAVLLTLVIMFFSAKVITGSMISTAARAETTKDNFRNTAQIIDPGRPVVLISSDYHMDRAVQAAEAAGFTDILRLPAPSSFINYSANILSEVILELVELMPGQ